MTPKQIKSMRKDMGMSQTKFGQAIGAHRITVLRWESGQKKPCGVSLHALERLKPGQDKAQ